VRAGGVAGRFGEVSHRESVVGEVMLESMGGITRVTDPPDPSRALS
jgi:hypothetical protein